MAEKQDQMHPQERRDRPIVDRLLKGNPEDNSDLAELARLRIRYSNFPGAREIQRDLDKVLRQWQMTEEELFEKTRQIHAAGAFYQVRGKGQEQEDWN